MTLDPRITRIEILGQDDEHLTVHGDGEGDRGVFLGEAPEGLWDTPEDQTWLSGARSRGSKPKNRKILHRDMALPFLIRETEAHTYEQNESYLIRAVGFELDEYDEDAKYARLALTTEMSGTRYLDIVQYKEPNFQPEHDPIMQQFADLELNIRVGMGDWYEDDVVSAAEFDGDGEGEVWVENPTPRVMLQTWRFTPGRWTIPDWSWRGKKGRRAPGGPDQTRFVTTPLTTDVDGVCEIHLDREQLMAEDEHETNILARFNNQFFLHPIPAYTQRQALPVYLNDCPAGGARIELIQPRLWSRPWGQELD